MTILPKWAKTNLFSKPVLHLIVLLTSITIFHEMPLWLDITIGTVVVLLHNASEKKEKQEEKENEKQEEKIQDKGSRRHRF